MWFKYEGGRERPAPSACWAINPPHSTRRVSVSLFYSFTSPLQVFPPPPSTHSAFPLWEIWESIIGQWRSDWKGGPCFQKCMLKRKEVERECMIVLCTWCRDSKVVLISSILQLTLQHCVRAPMIEQCFYAIGVEKSRRKSSLLQATCWTNTVQSSSNTGRNASWVSELLMQRSIYTKLLFGSECDTLLIIWCVYLV